MQQANCCRKNNVLSEKIEILSSFFSPFYKKLTEPLCGRLGCQKTSSCCKCLKLCWAIVLSFRGVRRRVRVRRRGYDHHCVHR